MNKRLYVGNISFQMTDEELKQLFSDFGEVQSVKIVIDKITGRKKGFAFVEMTSSEDAEAAISALDGKVVGGRTIRVSIARDTRSGPGGGGIQRK